MKKSVSYLVAAVFAVASVSAFAAKHMASEKEGQKPSAEQCKKDPKMKGCEQMKK